MLSNFESIAIGVQQTTPRETGGRLSMLFAEAVSERYSGNHYISRPKWIETMDPFQLLFF